MICDWVITIEQYTTLERRKYNIGDLSEPEQEVYREMSKLFEEGTESWRFSNTWRFEIEKIRGNRSRREMTSTPIYGICEDLESRLQIKEGIARPSE
jgi:hypothetical protein